MMRRLPMRITRCFRLTLSIQLMLQMFALPILIKKELYSKGYLINAI